MTRIPDALRDEYAQKRRHAEAEAECKREYIYKECPQVEQLDKQAVALAYKLGLLGLTGGIDFQQQKERTQKSIDELMAERSSLIQSMGLPADFTDIHYECALCKDTGYIGDSIKSICPCMSQRLIEYRFSTSNINQNECFDKFNFELFENNPQQLAMMKKVFSFAKKYADGLPDNVSPNNMIIYGNTGLGKSFLLNCIARVALEKNLHTIKITAYNLISSYMESFRKNVDVPDYIGCDVLMIDDLGTEPSIQNVTVETVFSILNERISTEKPTLIATNCMPDELAEIYGERVISRLFAPKITTSIHLTGDDIRLFL